MHEYSYLGMQEEFMDSNPLGQLNIDDDRANQLFNDKDELWQHYKSNHIHEALFDLLERIK